MRDKEVKQLCAVLTLAAVVLGGIGWAMLKVEGGAAAFPPLALAAACALTALGLWLGSKRTVAVLVISATAIGAGAIANRSDSSPPAEAHTISCPTYPNTQLGNVQRATCVYQQWMHMLYHIEMQQRAQARYVACMLGGARQWFWQGDSFNC